VSDVGTEYDPAVSDDEMVAGGKRETGSDGSVKLIKVNASGTRGF
jgi:hypothetical protein